MSQRRFIVSVVTQLLMIIQLSLAGNTCEPPGNCSGSQNCFYMYKEIKIHCKYSADINSCRCIAVNTSEMLPCNTFSNPSCWNSLPTTVYFGVICEDIAFDTCANNVGHTCNNCTSTGTEYTVWCLCKEYTSNYNCRLCNISSSSFPPTGTSLTSSSHNSPSLFTGSLTKPSLILSPFISPSTIAHAVSPVSTNAHAESPVSTIAHAVSVVIAGVIPTVCILIIGVFSLLVVLFIILYRRNKNKQMSVNQRGRASTLQQIDNIYYAHTLHNNREIMDEGEAPPDYSMITMENFETNGASANTSNTLVHMDTRQIMDNSQQDNNNYSTLSNNTGVATVTNQSAYEHVKDSHDPDYFDDLHVLQQIRAHKQ